MRHQRGRCLWKNIADQLIIQSSIDGIVMKGPQIRRQQKGQKNAAIADDGSYEGDDTAYKKYSQKCQYEAGGSKKAGIMKAGIGLVSPGAIDDKDDERKPYNESYDDKLQGEGQVYLLAACARERLKEAIEQCIGEDIA